MKFLHASVCLAVLPLCLLEARAQNPRDVPIEQDLQRERRIERRIDQNRSPATDPFVTPANPDGVVGFDGPPDPIDDGVDSGSPLPPGSPGDIDED